VGVPQHRNGKTDPGRPYGGKLALIVGSAWAPVNVLIFNILQISDPGDTNRHILVPRREIFVREAEIFVI
jgi:hypothetical protein